MSLRTSPWVLCLATALGFMASAPLGAEIIRPVAADSLQASFDTEEAERLLEPGSGSLRGNLQLAVDKGLLKKKETFVARDQLVVLLPMTSYMRAWEAKYGKNPVIGAMFINPRVVAYSARVLTDTQGNFEFRGLKPGRYLLVSEIPYKQDVTVRTDTGQTRHDIDWFNSTITSSPIYRENRVRVDQSHDIYAIVEINEGAETRFPK
ncbi:hypothetical protein [Pseudoxanthomonas winnipegensis]|uniref:hypothetical protein n=1 Tax=Pseudoxanthomonas winnipegensis TaxID=2480810 RepID=UPI003F82ADC8